MKKNTLTVEERRTLLLDVLREVLFMPEEDVLPTEQAPVTLDDPIPVG